MPLARILSRWACAGLAAVVFVSSLTCMTVTCPLVCADETGARVATAADASLPPCHRTGAADHHSTPPAGACGAGIVCCSTWLHDAHAYALPAPDAVRLPGTDVILALLPNATLPAAPAAVFAARDLADPPGPRPAPLTTSGASRAPPASFAAA